MISTNYADLLSFHRNSRLTQDIKTRLQRVSGEAVTGRVADQTLAAQGRIGETHLIQKALDDIEQAGRINSLIETRLEMTSQGINGARAALNGIDVRATIALSSGGKSGIETIAGEAKDNIHSVMAALGARHGSRNLFSGDAVKAVPFSGADDLIRDIEAIMAAGPDVATIKTALDDYFNDPLGGFETNIYQGSDTSPAALKLSNGESINLDVRGNDPVIKDTLRGLATLAAASAAGYAVDSNEFKELFDDGISFAATGNSGLIDLESRMGIHAETIGKANDRRNFEQLSLTQTYQTLTTRDQYEAAAELKALEVQLEGAYFITARLANLNLTSFLR